jgi:hypothetical protein
MTAHVVFFDDQLPNPLLVVYVDMNDRATSVRYVGRNGEYDGGHSSYDLVGFSFELMAKNLGKITLEEAIDECNKEALMLFSTGKPKEKAGALSCAERLKNFHKKKTEQSRTGMYVIYDERRGYWKPDGNGYTKDKSQAGLYSQNYKDIHSLREAVYQPA